MHQLWSPDSQDVFWSEPSSIANCYHLYTLVHHYIVIVICMLLPAQKCHSAAWSDIYRFEQVKIVRWQQVRRLRPVCGYWAQGPPIGSVWLFQWSWSAWYIFTRTLSIVYRCVAVVSVRGRLKSHVDLFFWWGMHLVISVHFGTLHNNATLWLVSWTDFRNEVWSFWSICLGETSHKQCLITYRCQPCGPTWWRPAQWRFCQCTKRCQFFSFNIGFDTERKKKKTISRQNSCA